MTMQTQATPAWRHYLCTLPEVDPPEALWSRVAAARRRPRPWRGPLLAGAAAAAVFAAVLAWPSLRGVAPLAPPSAIAATAGDTGLRRLDDDIALAYARNASEAELAALWQARERVLASLGGPEPALLARL